MSIHAHVPEVGPFALSLTVTPDHQRSTLTADIAAAVDASGATSEEQVQLWLESVGDGDDDLVGAAGFEPYRDLLQLRCPLPAAPSLLTTRSFVVGADEDAFIAANNRAFSWHPEQSGLTRERLAATMNEDWFDPEGFRLHEIDGRLAGFCWTKVHAGPRPCPGRNLRHRRGPRLPREGPWGPDDIGRSRTPVCTGNHPEQPLCRSRQRRGPARLRQARIHNPQHQSGLRQQRTLVMALAPTLYSLDRSGLGDAPRR